MDKGYSSKKNSDMLPLRGLTKKRSLSTHVAEAIRIYRDTDVVEKRFHRIKHSLGLDRIRMHGRRRVPRRCLRYAPYPSKLVIGFIALILSSPIHHFMLEQKLIRTLGKLRTQVIDSPRTLFWMPKR